MSDPDARRSAPTTSPRAFLQWRDASATRLRCRAAVIAPATEPVELGLTSRSAATSCREAPPSTIAIARTRRSSEYGLAITLSFQKESRAPDSLIRRPLGIPRFEAGEICSRRPPRY